MGYFASAVALLLALVVSGIGLSGAVRPPTKPLPISGATDVTVIMLSWNGWQISYPAAADAGEQLEGQGWSSPDTGQYGPLSRSYARTLSFGVGELREWAFLWYGPSEPQIARIRVRRWIEFPWWPRLWRVMSASS